MINQLPEPRLIFALIMIPARYMTIAGLFFYLFYKYKPHNWVYIKIQEKTPTGQQIKTEIIYSLITMFIFSLDKALNIFAATPGWLRMPAPTIETLQILRSELISRAFISLLSS